MTIVVYRRLILLLVAAIGGLIACICFLVLKCSYERIEAKSAWNLIAAYDRTRSQLSALNVPDTTDYLEIYAHAKLDGDSRDLNNIMERERTRMVKDLLADLRKKTGGDLGSDPETWIKRYSQSGTNMNSTRQR